MANVITGPTNALRENSPEVLRTDLLRLLLAYSKQGSGVDTRDVMWSLAPYHDCARRLGLDPAGFFDQVADATTPELRDVVRGFGRRTDTGPEDFGGYALIESADGPAYVWA
jgi:hypothetical protein